MYTTIIEGLTAYKKELAAYLKWSEELKKRTGADKVENQIEHIQIHGSAQDIKDLNTKLAKLEGMEIVLGMSKEEVKIALNETLKEVK